MNKKYWDRLYRADKHEAIVQYIYANPHILDLGEIISISREPKYYKNGDIYVAADLEVYTPHTKYIIEVKSSPKQRTKARQQIYKIAEMEAAYNTIIYLVWPMTNRTFKRAINSLVIEIYKPEEIYKRVLYERKRRQRI